MDVQSTLYSSAATCLFSIILTALVTAPVKGQTAAEPNRVDENIFAGAADASSQNVDAGSIDKLLELADKGDINQLSQVKVSGQTGSPSLDMPVSTVARQESTVGKSPAAVFVITNEMIHRSGAVCIPDVLRMVPGVQVAQIASGEWAISARGLNSQYANKLLVQIDGRTVYDLFFGGVIWDVQDVMLEDVERIEVIRGPGATIWGSNAVNGVINIISKRSQDTQGVIVQGGAGNHERGYTNARVGGRLSEDMTYRIYGKWFDRGPSYLPEGGSADDVWHQGRTGFRMDYEADDSNTMTLQGDYYDGNTVTLTPNQIPLSPFSVASNEGHVSGENILYRWKHTIDDDTDWTFQTYYDRTERHFYYPDYALNRDLFDLDFQHRFPLGTRNEIIWGCGYRFTQDSFFESPASSFFITVDPPQRFDNYFSYFLQDQITLVPDRWFFTAGSKFEHNNYTSFEFQPTARLLWTPTERHSIWGAISRGVHVPTRQTDDSTVRLPAVATVPMPTFPLIFGNRGLRSEELLAYEFGMRVQATERFSWDLALFYNQYARLISNLQGTPYVEPPAYLDIPYLYENGMAGETYGAELAANYTVSERWRLQCAYTYTRLFMHLDPGMVMNVNPGETPNNQVYLQSSWDLGSHWQFDLIGRYVDALLTTTPQAIPSYLVMDARLAWHNRKNMEVAVVGRNLTHGFYSEFTPLTSQVAYKVGPEVYGQITWRF
jgi:iron complex outermembrane recepter protein